MSIVNLGRTPSHLMPSVSLYPFCHHFSASQKWLSHNLQVPISGHYGLALFHSQRADVFNCRMFVLHFSACDTFRYLHDWHGKKNTSFGSSQIALLLSVVCSCAISLRTPMDRAFCCTEFGSSFLNVQYWHDRGLLSLPSLSRVGFSLPCSLKVNATNEMEIWIMLSARVSWDNPKNLPSWRAMAKAPKCLIHWLLFDPSRNTSSTSPIDPSHSIYSICTTPSLFFSCFPVAASSQVNSAAARSAKRH